MASEHESFCLPLLEAQACGVPAVVRDLPALRETGGAGTIFIAGDAPAHWAEAIHRLVSQEAAHRAAAAAGVAHADAFSWERTAAGLASRLVICEHPG